MSRPGHPQPTIIIGAVEWVALPDLGVPLLRARIDTGAHTSALHAEELEVFERDGAEWVRFRVPNRMRNPKRWSDCEAPVHDWRQVRCTSGESERRPVLESRIALGSDLWPLEINLTQRDRMRYPFLLGRSAMEDRVLVNPTHAYLHGKPNPSNPESH